MNDIVWTSLNNGSKSEQSLKMVRTHSVLTWPCGYQTVLGIDYISQDVPKVKTKIHRDPPRSISEVKSKHCIWGVLTQSWQSSNTFWRWSKHNPNKVQTQSEHCTSGVLTSPNRVCTRSGQTLKMVQTLSKHDPSTVWTETCGSQSVLGIASISQSVPKVITKVNRETPRPISEQSPNTVRQRS